MIRIVSPEHSFVRFSDQHLDLPDWMEDQLPGSSLGFALPIAAIDDMAFQFIAVTDTEEEADTLCATDIGNLEFKRVAGTSLGPSLSFAQYSAAPGFGGGGTLVGATRYRISPKEVLYYVPRMPDMAETAEDDIQCGGCFQLVMTLDWANDLASAVSNVFKWTCADTRFTTVLDYSSIQDEAGFIYCVSPILKNRIRLPLYLTRPTYPEEETEHRLSSGAVRITKAVVSKVYQVVTDYWPEWAIEAFRAIWLHDDVNTDTSPLITTERIPYKGEVVKEGPFEPQWQEYKNYPFAPVNMKVSASPFLMKKNNCGECPDYSDLLQVENMVLGPIADNTVFVYDLLPQVIATCCTPLTFTLLSYPLDRIDSISIAGDTLTFHTVDNPVDPQSEFIAIQVSCGGITKTFTITFS